MWLGSLRSSVCFSLKYTVSLFANSASLKSYSCYLGEFHLPKGYDTGIMVYNSSANRKVPLVLKNKGIATWYMCGPTVYDESHIGHACCYVKFDILRRIMEKLFGISVLLQMGITDIDDKIIKKAQESDLSTLDVARKYELEFFKGMAAMGVMPPSSVTRVTENIPHMISFCEKLIEKDFAYVTSEAVSAEVLNELPQDSDINLDPLKEDGRDFALWKIVKEDEPYWISPWGKGKDLWGNYWLHSGLLQVGNEIKMSKSIKNTVSIKEFLREHSTNDFRILCLQSPYRKNILYCSKTVFGAKRLYQKFHNFINEMELYSNGEISVPFIDEDKLLSRLQSTKDQVISLLADDFNTSQAILCLTNLIDSVNESLQSSNHSFVFKNDVTVLSACASYIDRMLEIFGVNVMCKKKLSRSFVHFMDAVNEFRNKIRLFALYQIDISQISRPADYIENNYTSFQQRINLIDDMKELSTDVSSIIQAVDMAYQQSYKFCSIIQNSNDKGQSSERTNLLTFCDELRSSIEKHGIAIKDRKGTSTWCLKL
ncbi:putative cysteine--tRNA ligase like protein [Argiope bruennichi]|uniref:Putative cysteine--tRNA ligase like protein n=1 Tax=Argiope bruennichi TaxID=94029 RepID=A0A8T0EZG7_ARGBR|nr:putative cysteine--tRNA ligase like protein [Argiope bruennichi]